MSILIGQLEFEGPYPDFDSLSDESGIYAVLIGDNDEFDLVELEDAEYVRTTLTNHEHRDFWSDHAGGTIAVAVHYTPDLTDRERREIKDSLLGEFELQLSA